MKLACCRCLGEVSSVNLATGVAPWMVKPPGAASAVLATPIKTPHAAWVHPTGAGSLTWVDDNGDGASVANAAGLWVYNLKVEVPKDCIIPFVRPIKFKGAVSADNRLKLLVNGNPITQAGGTAGVAFQTLTSFSATLSPGINTIRVEVVNLGGPTGMAFQASLEVPCAKGPKVTTTTPPPPVDAPPEPKGITQSGVR